MDALTSFIQCRRVNKGEPHTHTSMITPRGSYYIESDDEDKFWTKYCNAIIRNDGAIGLTEQPKKFGPLRIDFDFKFPLEEGVKRKYKQKDILNIIHVYQNILGLIVDPSVLCEDRLLYCIVLEKIKPRVENGTMKDGFHLHFPHFICDEYVQNIYIRDKIMEKLEHDKEFEDFRKRIVCKIIDTSNKLSLRQQIEKMVDPIAAKNWLLYGSKKNENLESYAVTCCYDESLDIITLEKIFDNELDSLRMIGRTKSARYYLPRLLSIRKHDTGTSLGDNIKVHMIHRPKRKLVKQTKPEEAILADLKIIEEGKLIDMLSDHRADDYMEWMYVGWVLYNIGQGHDKALNMWIEFSRRSEKFEEGGCEKQWDKMELRGITISYLIMMAKSDSPTEFNEWRDEHIDNALQESVEKYAKPTHYSIAKVMHKMYEYKFICASHKHDIWYEFYNHRWHPVDNGISILKLITMDIADKFSDFSRLLNNSSRKEDTDNEKYEKWWKRSIKILEELGQAPFCRRVLEMCKILFCDDNFSKRMDENRDLLGFENGVYDLKQGIFRDGSPDDYITLSTGRNYYQYSYQDEDIIYLNEYLAKVHVNEKIRDYFLDFICSCFQGGNREKLFAIFSGPTDAGKSVLLGILELVFGEYCMNFPRETFIVGRSSTAGGARPDLARVRGKRIAFVKEIAKDEKLHIGVIKEMTGNDSFWARNLYDKGSDIKPMFTLILMCNEPPKVPAHDEATWNRIRVIPFESCFPKSDNPRKHVPHDLLEQRKLKVFPRDSHLEDRIEEFVNPLTWLLLERFKTYYKEGI